MLKFIHAGDVHLGNPFTGLSQHLRTDFQAAIQKATFTALDRLVETAIVEKVDLVLFPGDLFHGSDNSALIQERLLQAFRKLDQADIWVAVSFGNHDFQQSQLAHPTWPDHVIVFDSKVETRQIMVRSGDRVSLTGFSYSDRFQRQSALPNFPVKDSQLEDYHLGLYHGAIGQNGEAYAAFNLDEMVAKGYDYWALGHIHIRQVLHENPMVAYSGNLQGLNRNETGPKGFYLVSDEAGLGLQAEFRPVAPVVWENSALADCPDLATLQEELSARDFNETTLLSIQLTGTIGQELRENDSWGLLLEKLQQSCPPSAKYWPIKVDLVKPTEADAKPVQLPADVALDEAIAATVNAENIGQLLSEQVPIEVRDYFYSKAGQEDLQNRMQRLIAERDPNEN